MIMWLNQKKVAKAIQEGMLPKSVDWYGGFVGVFICFLLWIACGSILFFDSFTPAQVLFIMVFAGLSCLSYYGVYNLLHERKLFQIQTGLSAANNHQLLTTTFKQLDCSTSQNNLTIIQASVSNKWTELNREAIELISDNTVHLAIVEISSTKGRFPFFRRGDNEKLSLLVNKINEQLNKL